MEDLKIIELYWNREESALEETQKQYGGYCYSIAYRILGDKEDSDECVNDTWLRAWKAIPPQRPLVLAAFLGKITRHLSFDRWRKQGAKKRGGGQIPLVLEELGECLEAPDRVEDELDKQALVQALNCFLHQLPQRECGIFLSRYWYTKPLAEIAEEFFMKENAVKASLHRTRKKLRLFLQREGISL